MSGFQTRPGFSSEKSGTSMASISETSVSGMGGIGAELAGLSGLAGHWTGGRLTTLVRPSEKN